MKSKKLKTVSLVVREISKEYKFLLPFLLVISIFQGIYPMINIIMPKYILDELVNGKRTNLILIYIGILALGNFIFKTISEVLKEKLVLYEETIYLDATKKLGIKATKIPIQEMEKKSSLDLLERGTFGTYEMGRLIDILVAITASIITIITTIGILINNDWRLIVIILICNIINILCFKKIKNLDIDYDKRSIPENRAYRFVCSVTYDFKFAKDIRLYKANKLFLVKAKETMDKILKTNHEYFTKHGFWNGMAQGMVQIQFTITFILLGVALALKQITVGTFTMVYGAANQFGRSFNTLIQSYTSMVTIAYNLSPYYEVLAIEEENTISDSKANIESPITIEFKNVSFKYPNIDENVIEDLSFKINPKETLAIVGKNGAGKTTIIKLLCRLYKPQKGQILINGIDIYSLSTEEYKKLLAVVFQDFKLIPGTVAENILCKKQDDIKDEDINLALDKLDETGIRQWIEKQKYGINNQVLKIYDNDGLMPSGGQEQKIAISRALAKNGHIIILDEPTAALDPKSEEEVFENLIKLTKGKTSIFISHRLSSTRIADRIIVLDKGKIIEEGSHESLLKEDGLYAKMFTTQASQYAS